MAIQWEAQIENHIREIRRLLGMERFLSRDLSADAVYFGIGIMNYNHHCSEASDDARGMESKDDQEPPVVVQDNRPIFFRISFRSSLALGFTSPTGGIAIPASMPIRLSASLITTGKVPNSKAKRSGAKRN